MGSIFLSYCRQDGALARLIANELSGAGHSVWWDRHIKGGAQYSKEIDQALTAADVVVVLWSADSIESPWVRDEAEAGRDSGRLIPVSTDDSRPPLGFRQFQTIDLRDWRRTGDSAELRELLDALEAAPGQATQLRPGAARDRPGPGADQHNRRSFVTAAGAIGVLGLAGAGTLVFRRFAEPAVPREVELLMLQAKQLLDQNTHAGQNQAIGLYQRVVKMLPEYADGWGKLGVAYGVPSHYRDRPEAIALRAKAESAGRRALDLDPGNVYGELALSVALPFVGHWAERDQRLMRALAREPDNDDLLTFRAVVLQFDGRQAESVPCYERIQSRPLTPAVYTNYIQALWSAGRVAEVDQAMDDAASLYPSQPSIWFARVNILAYSRRTDAAIALIENAEGRPVGVDSDAIARLARLATAISSRDPAEADLIMAEQRQSAHRSARGAEYAIRNGSALGRLDDVFAIAEAYYFARDFTIPDYDAKGSTFSPEQRQTRLLFEPVTKEMRADARFERLVRDVGFDRYWKESGNQPDYRRLRQA